MNLLETIGYGELIVKKSSLVTLLVIVALFALGIGWYFYNPGQRFSGPPIKVGILHSLTGTMAISEKSVVDAELMGIDEINAKGGLLGRKIQPVIVDGASNWPQFAKMAEKLITQDKVSVVFGCWNSASRKTVKPVFEKYGHLLFYPVQYEGLEQSPNIVYLGAAPNQQIIPAVKWSIDHIGKRFFLVGSDYVFPRTANEIIKNQIQSLGGEVVGEEYLLLGSKDVGPMVQKILAAKPDVILNTINGDSNVAFFQALRAADITPDKIPVMSFSIAEDELRSMNAKDLAGNYAAWNYYQSVESDINKGFVERFKKKYGQDRVTDDPMEAAYDAVYLWAQAVTDANSDAVEDVQRTIKKQSYNAPEGTVYIDPENQHTWKIVRIGKIREDGQFDIVWSSDKPIQPIPFPTSKTREEWERFLNDLYTKWNGNWANPGT